MNRGITIIVTVLLFLLSIGLVLIPKNYFLTRLSPQHTISPDSLEDSFNPEDSVVYYDNKPIAIPGYLSKLLDTYKSPQLASSKVLGDTTGNAKRIEVDLTNQRLYAYEGDQMIYNFLISSGKWGRTPTGVFDIWIKLRATRMTGGSKKLNTYYNLPNVPYTMYFYNAEIPKWQGFGIHGAYWHNNFGHPMSHGCINMKIEEAKLLYEWADPTMNGKNTIHASTENPGTQVVIYGTAPNS